MITHDSDGAELEHIRILVPLWIGTELYQAGDKIHLPTAIAEALRASGRVEIIS